MAGSTAGGAKVRPPCRLNNGDSVDRCSLGVVFVRKIIHRHATNIVRGRVVDMVAPPSLRNC